MKASAKSVVILAAGFLALGLLLLSILAEAAHFTGHEQLNVSGMTVGTELNPSFNFTTAINLRNASRAFVVMYQQNVSQSEASFRDNYYSVQIANETVLNFTHGGGTNNPARLGWFIAEFDSGLRVLRGTARIVGRGTTVNFTEPFNLSKSFILYTSTGGSTPSAQDERVLLFANFTNTTQIILARNDTDDFAFADWQVIEFQDNSSVQSGTATMDPEMQIDVAINPVPVNASFLVFNHNSSGTNGIEGRYFIRGELVNETVIRFNRTGSGNTYRIDISWFVITLNHTNASVQRINGTVTGMADTFTISGVNMSRTIVIATNDCGTQDAGKSAILGHCLVRYNLTNPTTLQASRGGSGESRHDPTFQAFVIEVPFTASPPPFQSAYRFFNNNDSTFPGSPLAAQDTPATLDSSGQAFRLRALLHNAQGSTLAAPSWSNSLAASASFADSLNVIKALDEDNVYIAYYDSEANKNIRFANSTNGGLNWTLTTIDPSGDNQKIAMQVFDKNTIYVAYGKGSNVMFANSTNGGLNWTTTTIAAVDGDQVVMHAINRTHIFIAYNTFSANTDLNFANSTNGGRNWSTLALESGGGDNVGVYNAIYAIDENKIIIGTQDGSPDNDLVIYNSTNGGRNWTKRVIDPGGDTGYLTSMVGIKNATNATIFISYQGTTDGKVKLAKSTDNGTTWTLFNISSGDETSVDAIDANTIFVAYRQTNGSDTDLYVAKSTNGGSTWAVDDADPGCNAGWYASLDAVDANTVYVSHTYFACGSGVRFSAFKGAQYFKLQYAERSGTCDTGFSGETYADVNSTTPIAFNDNPAPGDGIALNVTNNDPTHGSDAVINQSYEEANFFTNPKAIAAGQDGKWDFALKDSNAPAGTAYCLRIVYANGTLPGPYVVIPEITTSAAPAPSDTCTPPSNTNWTINAPDNCVISGQSVNVTRVHIRGASGYVIFRHSNVTSLDCRVEPDAGASIMVAVEAGVNWGDAC